MKKILYIAILFCITANVFAQNNTSPYSIIGIGDIERSVFDRATGMASTGLALSSNRFLFQSNPASYASLDDKTFFAEVSTRYKSSIYSGQPIVDVTNNNANDLQFKKFAFAIKMKPRWGISLGLLPFSTSNYSFAGKKPVNGTPYTLDAYYQGAGSTNQFYIANSFKITKNLSMGIQSAWLFGSLNQKESILATTINDSTLVTTRNIFLGNLYFNYGLQYHKKINKNWDVSLGAKASVKTKLRANDALQVQNGSSYIVNNDHYQDNYFTLPLMYSGGIAAVLKDKFTFALDYSHQNWSSLNYKGYNYELINSTRISGGFEYSNKIVTRDFSIERYFLQAGFYYDASYMKVYGNPINDYGFSLGAGFIIPRAPNVNIHTSVQVGTKGSTDNGLVKENYTQINLGVSFREFWLIKLKRYD